MKHKINKAAIEKTRYDSKYVGILSYHAIQIKEEGNYIGNVIHKNEVVNLINITATEKCESMQINLDFQKFEMRCKDHKPCEFSNEIKPGGYVLLLNSWSDKAFQFKLEKVGRNSRKKFLFNSEKLEGGDLYACTLIRPGTYEVLCNGKKASKIYVEYPTIKTSKSRLSEAVRVQVHENEIKDKEIRVLPMQGLVFELHADCRIQINLIKEEKSKGLVYERPKALKKLKRKKPLKKYRWQNPKYKQPS